MTDRLYYVDPYVTAFDAQVLAVERLDDGRWAATLDRTAFYATSGGQPFDTGTLGDVRVTDVVERDDGSIAHLVERELAPGPVHGRLDWARRFEHMQQHTGQHVLSAVFDRVHQARTVSFHLGSGVSIIDLEPEVTGEQIANAVGEANTILWENRPVTIRFSDPAAAAGMPLRKESRRQGQLRLIDIEGCDLSACGGTHVARTAEVGAIVAPAWERYKRGTRVSFACGIRVLRHFDALRDIVSNAMRTLGASATEIGSALERQQSELKENRRAARTLQGKLAGFEAEALASRAVAEGTRRHVLQAVDGWDAAGLKEIATGIAARAGYVAVLFSASLPANVVVARAADVDVDAASILRSLTSRFGGKGGGRPDLAQGGGLTGDLVAMLEFARTAITAGA